MTGYDIKNLFFTILGKELKAKYKGMVLGYAWSLLLPLCQSLVFLVVFSKFLRFPIKDYFLFLTIGFVFWQFFSNSVIQGASVLINNSNLIKKTTCPRLIFVTAAVGAEAVHFLVTLPILLMLCCGRIPEWSNLYSFFATLLTLGLFTFGTATLVALCNVFFRDLERLLQVLLQVWFYITPIFYSMTQIPDRYHDLFLLNPLYIPLRLFRATFYSPEWLLNWSCFSLIAGTLFCVLSVRIFYRFEKHIAELL